MKINDMFWIYLLVAVFTGINLLTHPLTLAPLMWGIVFSIMFIWSNFLAVEYKLWLGIIWLLCSAVVGIYILKAQELGVEMRITVSMFSFFSSIWYACKEYRTNRKE